MKNRLSFRILYKDLQSLFTLLLFSFSFYLSAQQLNQEKGQLQKKIDPKVLFNKTKLYMNQGHYKEAVYLLSEYYPEFSENLNINWLFAHALWSTNNLKSAKSIFKKSIVLAPNNKELQLDYARFLYNTGQIIELEPILRNELSAHENQVEYLVMLGYVSFWRGKIQIAKSTVEKIKSLYPNSKDALNLQKEIRNSTATYLDASFEYQTDSQPLDYFKSNFVISKYNSRYFKPKFRLTTYRFSPEGENTLIVDFSNQFSFDQIRLKADVSIGLYDHMSDKKDWIGSLLLKKNIFKNSKIQLSYRKSELLSTIVSTRFNLTQQNLSAEYHYENKYIEVNTGCQYNFFDDDNSIYSIYAWILSQPIKFGGFSFQFGYSYNFTDSEEVLFVFSDINTGIYDPYFTPKDLATHSGIFTVSYSPHNKLTIQTKLNYGFSGDVQNPYPVEVSPTNIEIGGFYADIFTPIEWTGSIKYTALSDLILSINYIKQETFFYERENINFGINLRF